MHRWNLARALVSSLMIAPAGLPALAGQAISPPPAAEKLTPAQTQADVVVLRSALEEAHGALYRFSTKAELNGRFDAYRSRLNHDVTQREFIALVSEMTEDGYVSTRPVRSKVGISPRTGDELVLLDLKGRPWKEEKVADADAKPPAKDADARFLAGERPQLEKRGVVG